jgi:hypothetical protein
MPIKEMMKSTSANRPKNPIASMMKAISNKTKKRSKKSTRNKTKQRKNRLSKLNKLNIK